MTPLVLSVIAGVVVRTTAVLLLALGATTLLRRASAATRHLVWTVALAGVLVLPFLGRVVPEWRVVPVPAELAVSKPGAAAPPRVQDAQPVAQAAPVMEPVRPEPAAPVSRISWTAWALGIWAAGGALLLLRLLAGVARIWWMERRSAELADARWTSLTDGLARKLRLGRMVTLLRGEHATVPMTWGVMRPVVLLPAEADGWSEERRTVVLAHELAHIRRWDALTQWIAHLAVAVHWYNPLVWAAARRLRQEREQACDDAVLALGARPAVYADHLLDIVRSLGTSSGPAAALAMARRSQFEGRLLAILDAAVPRTGVGRAVALATMAGGALFILPLAALSPAQPRLDEPLTVKAQVSTPATRMAGARVPPASALVPKAAAPALVDGLAAPVPRDKPAAPAPPSTASRPSTPSSPSHPSAGSEPSPVSLPSTPSAAPSTLGAMMDVVRAGGGADLYDEIIRLAAEIQSSTERRLVLDDLLKRPDLRRDHVVAIIGATHTMSSDTDRRLVLTPALAHRALGGEVPQALVVALGRFTSSTDQRLVLTEVLERLRPGPTALAALLHATGTMSSDTDKRLVLTAAAERHNVEGAARAAYMDAVRSMSSDTDRRLALAALLGPTARGDAPALPVRRGAVPLPPSGETGWDTELVSTETGSVLRYRRLRMKSVVLGRDPLEVRAIGSDGALILEESSGGRMRVIRGDRASDGSMRFTQRVDGQLRPFDAAARSWMLTTMAGMVK
jgi:beta-lactamase regulating signal transducer with metallopeptidase domain